MRLYLLRRNSDAKVYDCADAFVIRAIRPLTARKLASEEAGAEGPQTWLDKKKSSCELLKEHGSQGIILQDFHPG